MGAGHDPAYPVFPETGGGHAAAFRGLTKRERFALAALQGIIAAHAPTSLAGRSYDKQFAKDSVVYADALLAELAKEPPHA